MVGVAKMVKALGCGPSYFVGSSPIAHPKKFYILVIGNIEVMQGGAAGKHV